jgi:CIC family chloride channel protein
MPLDFRVAIVKLLGGTVALGSGLFMGREGPTVQLGAALAAPLSQLLKSTVEHRRQLIAAGAGAGLAAAFNAPLAGVIFVLEELLKEVKASTVIISVVACGAAAIVLNLFSYHHIRSDLHTTLPSITSFAAPDIPFYILLGLACGVLGAIFNASVIGSLNTYQKLKFLPLCLRIALAGLLSGLIISCLPEAYHNYAGVRGLFLIGADPGTAAVVFVEFFLLTLIAYGSGAPGGLFAPTLVLGSSIGCLIGYLQQALTGASSVPNYALVGMGAFFSGVARVPLTAVAITFELTNNFALVAPLMIASVVASVLGDVLDAGGIYDQLMVWNGINLKSQESTFPKSVNIRAMDVMHIRKDDILPSTTPVKNVMNRFRNSTQRGVPIVDKGQLVGVVSQSDLTLLLESDRITDDSPIREVMTPHPVAVSPYDSLEDILPLFIQYHFSWLPVADERKFHGIISESDVVQALFTAQQTEKDKQDRQDTSP